MVQCLLLRRFTSQILLFCLILLVLPPVGAQAQNQAAITIDVQAGYDGSYRVSHWFPVTATVGNDGPDVQGVLEWSWPDGTGSMYQHVIDLPRGARKQVNFAVTVDAVPRSAEVLLRDAQGAVVARTRVRLEPLDVGQFTIGVLSSDRTLLNSLVGMQFDNSNVSGVSVLHLDPALLPENPLTLSGIEALFLHDIASADFSAGQLAALEDWVRAGGQLVVSGGASAERSVPGVASLLPVTVGGLQQGTSLVALSDLAPEAATAALESVTTLSTVTPLPGARLWQTTICLQYTTWAMGAGSSPPSTWAFCGPGPERRRSGKRWSNRGTEWKSVLRTAGAATIYCATHCSFPRCSCLRCGSFSC
ncbi:hypothetical protein HC891_09440 [Candidatus Gracilibacteria bacterium]|nr:hypothetical protein [Candidatus Gracilibacteria bacterium]